MRIAKHLKYQKRLSNSLLVSILMFTTSLWILLSLVTSVNGMINSYSSVVKQSLGKKPSLSPQQQKDKYSYSKKQREASDEQTLETEESTLLFHPSSIMDHDNTQRGHYKFPYSHRLLGPEIEHNDIHDEDEDGKIEEESTLHAQDIDDGEGQFLRITKSHSSSKLSKLLTSKKTDYFIPFHPNRFQVLSSSFSSSHQKEKGSRATVPTHVRLSKDLSQHLHDDQHQHHQHPIHDQTPDHSHHDHEHDVWLSDDEDKHHMDIDMVMIDHDEAHDHSIKSIFRKKKPHLFEDLSSPYVFSSGSLYSVHPIDDDNHDDLHLMEVDLSSSQLSDRTTTSFPVSIENSLKSTLKSGEDSQLVKSHEKPHSSHFTSSDDPRSSAFTDLPSNSDSSFPNSHHDLNQALEPTKNGATHVIVNTKDGNDDNDDIIPNEFIVRTKTVDISSMLKYARSIDVHVKDKFDIGNFRGMIVHGSLAQLQKFTSHWKKEELVEVSPNRRFAVSMVQYNAPWNLARISTRERPRNNIFCYNRTSNGKNVDVYVLDSGIMAEHPEFEGRAFEGPSFTGSKSGRDINGHGTHVAGLIAGKTYGVSKGATVFGIKIFDPERRPDSVSIIKGMEYVWKQAKNSTKPTIVNLSVSGKKDDAVNEAVSSLIQSGIYVIAAAGNNFGKDACGTSPASAFGVLTVGAIDENDQLADFSNVGSCVHIHAPGVNVHSAWVNKREEVRSGTSMAAPHVTGILASLLSSSSIRFSSVRQGLDELLTLATRISTGPYGPVKFISYNGYSVDGKSCQSRRFPFHDLFKLKLFG